MGLKTADFPPVDPATFLDTPYLDRIKLLSRHWVDFGFGTPKITALIYIARLVFFYALIGVIVSTLTAGINPLHVTSWWTEPLVYQKLVLWTVLLEAIGFGGSWGPLSGHFKPMTGGILYWARPKTIRLAPWPGKVPLTAGDTRTVGDVVVYLALIVVLAAAFLLPGSHSSSLDSAIGTDNSGLVNPGLLTAAIVLLVVIGLRDKVIFIAARGEQYLPALIIFAAFPFVGMIVAAKLLIVSVWVCAGISKFGKHFSFVIPPMMSNAPWLTSIKIKRAHYRNFPEDLRPSKVGGGVAHTLGTFVELVTPFVLLFSTNIWLTAAGVVVMIGFHLVITSTFPLATPLEWNVLFAFMTAFLFLGYPASDGFGITDMNVALAIVTIAALVFFPIVGNLRPDLVSFLPSMRQYAGNWATGMWAMAPGAEAKLNEHIIKSAPMTKDQLAAIYGPEAAEVVLHQVLGWRSLHSQGRGLNSVMINQLGDDINTYTLREAEFSCNAIVAFNFGDGHLHRPQLIESIQTRCQFEPGEFIVVWVESQPIHRQQQDYLVVDAALGIVERGHYDVADAVAEQPWLPNGPIATHVEWRLEGYERVSHTVSATNADTAPAGSQFAEPESVFLDPTDVLVEPTDAPVAHRAKVDS